MREYKYVHFLWANELKFNRPLVEMINCESSFNPSEHLFITQYDQVRDALSAYSNVHLDKNGSPADLINRYAEAADWLIAHGLTKKLDTIRIKRKNLKKIVWRTWGGSRQKSKWDGRHVLRSLINKAKDVVYYLFYKHYYGKAPVIGIANTVDIIDLQQWKWTGSAKLLPMDYLDIRVEQIVSRFKNEGRSRNDRAKIMVGHQGTSGENHVAIVKRLLESYEEEFDVYLPLSYGEQSYIDTVKAELTQFKDDRVHIMDRFMPFEQYMAFLADVDVAIIDELSSMALGNICYLLYYRKKLFLNKDGVIKKAFDKDHLPYSLTEEIGKMDFSELVKPASYSEPITSDLVFGSYTGCVKDWATVLEYLDGLSDNGRR